MINLFKSIFICPKKRKRLELERAKKEWDRVKYDTFNKGDIMDYDGMGDWGRFPSIKK